ncbi:RNA polymerase subunit sigma-70 [Niastella vici]|uniref:RNA polymerase subunit sigma-70 n=1 Tax=Niastella vici TaxID=1703345 RepID=A0A1V9FW28_9BACT|nr:sigma-70 family RNA polymerase sigma factor [Niastella vici]OQP62551.1 RNA polymerase subunit sigma-70 [Niastella vici]
MTQTMAIADAVVERKALFMQLYQQAFPLVAKYVRSMGGSFDEAKDVFQDALVIYYEKLVDSPVQLQHSERAYILGIARHIWSKKNKQNNRLTALDDSLTGIADNKTASVSATDKLLDLLHTSGQKCMELLQAFYYDKLPMRRIAGLFGFSSERSATVQKYKCLEKVRDIVKEKSLGYEDFLE